MANLYYAASYKNKIINLLLKNENFVKVINPASDSKCPYLDAIDILLGGEWVFDGKTYKEQGQVFDYEFVNETTTQKTFVFVETDIDSVREHVFADFNLYVYIFTEKELIRLSNKTVPTVTEIKEMGFFADTYANRIDVLCDIVDRTLNGTDKLPGIGNVEPASKDYVTLYKPTNKYYGKCLKYKITNYNDGGDEYGD